MKEVGLQRYAGPFALIPFEYFVQSPIGLVPKGDNETRLIFHLSYDFLKCKSVNYYTPESKTRVNYYDLDDAVNICNEIPIFEKIFFGRTDFSSAFRILPTRLNQYFLLFMKAEDLRTGRTMYFLDRRIPFGSSISCAIFQKFSNCLKFLIEKISGKYLCCVNYLDDFLFIQTMEENYNRLVRRFIDLSTNLGVSIADEKTQWAMEMVIFLGIVINSQGRFLSIPEEKRGKALSTLNLLKLL